MSAPRAPVPAGVLLALVVLVAASAGCLGPTRGGEVVAAPTDHTPDDAVDRSAVDAAPIATAVDRARSDDESVTVAFSGAERAVVRAASDDLRSDSGVVRVRCDDGGAVRVDLRLYS